MAAAAAAAALRASVASEAAVFSLVDGSDDGVAAATDKIVKNRKITFSYLRKEIGDRGFD